MGVVSTCMDRRTYLGAVVATTVVAGCSSDSSSGESNSDETETSRPNPPTLVEHDISRGPTGGYEVTVTMANETDTDLNRGYGEVKVFNNDTRLASGQAAVIDLSAGNTGEESALLEEFAASDVTSYTITMTGETEDYGETQSTENEFTGDDFREKLR